MLQVFTDLPGSVRNFNPMIYPAMHRSLGFLPFYFIWLTVLFGWKFLSSVEQECGVLFIYLFIHLMRCVFMQYICLQSSDLFLSKD